MTAAEAIAESKRLSGKTVTVDHFGYEEETDLWAACADAKQNDAETETVFWGEGWRVKLLGNGDPR